ncbi:MAG: DUF3883 domain-containing protein [Baekduia sp.]
MSGGSLTRSIQDALDAPWRELTHLGNGDPVVRAQAADRYEDQGRSENRVRQDYTGRYPIELLQNAHDASAAGGTAGTVSFVVTRSALLIANEGEPFVAERVRSLIRLGSSDKRAARNVAPTIGYKGVGFTSVFEVTDRPQIIGRDVAFGFDRLRARREISRVLGRALQDAPGRGFPFRLSSGDWADDAAEVSRLFDDGAVTVVRLPFRRAGLAASVEAHMLSTVTPEVMLFMSHVDELHLRGLEHQERWSRTQRRRATTGAVVHLASATGERRGWIVHRGAASVTRKMIRELDDPLWAGTTSVDVAVALPWRGRPWPEAGPQQVHVYFPTDDNVGRAVLVHGDFYVDSSRRHVEDRGPGGAISRLVAKRAAELTAELAESVADAGSHLLACLAETESPSGFGRAVAEALDTRLARSRIARPADGSPPKRPSRLSRLALASVRQERQLLSILSPDGDLLMPGDDTGPAAELLGRLGMPELTWDEIARRVDLPRSSLEPGAAMRTLARWVDSLGEHAQEEVAAVLRERPVLLDVAGRWRAPTALMMRSAQIPRMPARLQAAEVAAPEEASVRRLLRRLSVRELTLRAAVDRVVATTSALTSDAERRAVHDFLRAAWEVDRHAFDGPASKFLAMPVPVTALRGKTREWRGAGSVYFTSHWTSNAVAERLYGPFGEAEFLAVTPPRDPSAARRDEEFYRRLGVAEHPRVIRRAGLDTAHLWHRPLQSFREWEHLDSVRQALKCGDGHPQTSRHISMPVLDRLDALLDRRSRETASVLAAFLADGSSRLGAEAEIHCTNTGHSGRGHYKRAQGYQRWRLETTAWVPVRNDPGGADFRSPLQAWTGTRLPTWLLVPQGRLAPSTGRSLRLMDVDRPSVGAVEESLLRLRDAFPDLAGAPPDVHRSAAWLLKRLDRAARRTEPSRCPPLPSSRAGEPCWSVAPVVRDEASASLVDKFDLLPAGSWTGLRHRYGLRRASEAVESRVRLGKRMKGRRLVAGQQGASLLAYLSARGADADHLARRLATIRESVVTQLDIELRPVGEQRWILVSRPYVLRTERDRLSRSRGATLFWVPPIEGDMRIDLARDLAAYLDAPDFADAIALFLLAQSAAIDSEHISEDDVAEAARQVRAHRRGRDEEVADELEDLADLDLDADHSGQGSDASGRVGDGDGPAGGNESRGDDAEDAGSESDCRDAIDVLPPIRHEGVVTHDLGLLELSDGEEDGEGRKTRRRRLGGGGGGAVDWTRLERDRRLYGRRGEEVAYQNERKRLSALGYEPGLVKWVSQDDETSSFDLLSVDDDGGPRYIEVKATTSADPAEAFPISTAELRFAMQHRDRYLIYRVTDVRSATPEMFRCRDPMSAIERELAILRMSKALLSLPLAARSESS